MSASPTTFGKYFLTEKIATGGMAEIYLAKLLGPGGFEKLLIIKQIHPKFGDRPEFVELFVREAKTLVSLSHGNIVPVYELGVLAGTYFIAMEYIDGPTLAELGEAALRRGTPIEPAVAAFVCSEVLKGLDYAHRKGAGVIHRDLSPRNVMLSRDGEVKIVDFGIAAAVDDNLGHDDGEDGKPVGSFPYMSPEQARREPLTPASDLFTVGILLWEALTGSKLFARDTPEATLTAVLDAPIEAPSARNAAVPPALDQICLRALARDPRDRFPSASEFHSRLSRYLYSVDTPVTATALSQIVARTCPPVPRQQRAATSDERAATDEQTPTLERTPVMNRTQPMTGRRRATQTFATHVQFKKVLERATPLLPFDAISELEEAALATTTAETAPPIAPPADEEAPAPTLKPSGRRAALTLVVALALAAAVAGGLWLAGRPSSGGAAGAIFDAGQPDAARPITDASIPDAGSPDAAPPPDAHHKRPARADASPRVTGSGTLKIGVKPWAKVYVDGAEIGEASGKFTVPAGRHKVRLVYDAGDRQAERTFTVQVEPDEVTETPYVDFTQ